MVDAFVRCGKVKQGRKMLKEYDLDMLMKRIVKKIIIIRRKAWVTYHNRQKKCTYIIRNRLMKKLFRSWSTKISKIKEKKNKAKVENLKLEREQQNLRDEREGNY